MHKSFVSFLSASALAIALSLIAACAAPPKTLDLSLSRPTAAQKFVATLVPPATPAPLNAMHSWQVRLTAPDGRPVRGARIEVDGGMPQHGHGLPSRPQVTRELADGTYLIEGMKFSMTGWWTLQLSIQSADAKDQVTFNTVIDSSGKHR